MSNRLHQDEYRKLTQDAAIHDASGRTQIRMTGTDRANFLHGFCTNDIKRLSAGEGCEAFITNVQGKTLGFVEVFCCADHLLLLTAPGQAETLLTHLKRYVLRSSVQFEDQTASRGRLLVAGPRADSVLESVLRIDFHGKPLSCAEQSWNDTSLWIGATNFLALPAYWITCEALMLADLMRQFSTVAGGPISAETANIARVESGTPEFGIDISSENLPQELGIDSRAISFDKGCYLGQETVARIDAMGHVNRHLVGVRFEGDSDTPVEGELSSGEKIIGRTTSAVFSPKWNAPLSLAYVRRGFHTPGTKLSTAQIAAEVVSLP